MKSLAWRMRSLTWGSGWGEREHQCHVDSYTSSINRISMAYRSCIDSIWMSYRCIWISHRAYIKRISIPIGCISVPCRLVYVVYESSERLSASVSAISLRHKPVFFSCRAARPTGARREFFYYLKPSQVYCNLYMKTIENGFREQRARTQEN